MRKSPEWVKMIFLVLIVAVFAKWMMESKAENAQKILEFKTEESQDRIKLTDYIRLVRLHGEYKAKMMEYWGFGFCENVGGYPVERRDTFENDGEFDNG
jgi:hypothetical protein